MEEAHQQQIQVVIRIKPTVEANCSANRQQQKCVYVSAKNKDELVVQTPSKKEYFVFDQIANENCSQQELYNKIGRSSLLACQKGYNCCLFAYGQTGAGKTYSIFGDYQAIINDIHSQSRGILPRLLSQLFEFLNAQTDEFKITCSYIQIYNQQILDLLNPTGKVKQIREDIKKGVFIQQLTQQQTFSYENSIEVLMKGAKNRKIAATDLNQQSSRSHTIFTIKMEYNVKQEDSIRTRRSKINIVDLAGSQRTKLAKVQGQRLKQGCNINKSLHVLGNVINALVQSIKKKKHIPYRDSKLTHFLKDSLGGNSITKLLANIQPNKRFLGDTLSTLMFAKRVKIIRTKVEVNQKTTQSYEQLRKEVRKLRQQLAEARFIQNQTNVFHRTLSIDNSDQQTYHHWKKAQTLNQSQLSQFDSAKNQKILDIFEQNQAQYKSLIQIYEEHMKYCSQSLNANGKKAFNIHNEWKNIQKKNQSLNNLLRNFPAFTRIFKQNIYLKNNFDKAKDHKSTKNIPPHPTPQPRPNNKSVENVNIRKFDPLAISGQLLAKRIQTENLQKEQSNQDIQFQDIQVKNFSRIKSFQFQNQVRKQYEKQIMQKYEAKYKQQTAKLVSQYEKILDEIQQKTLSAIQKLDRSYADLLKQNNQKDQKIKELRKRNNFPPDVEKLLNQNQYLKLNVLELEQQISRLQLNQSHYKIKIKNLKQQIRKDQKQGKLMQDQDQSFSIEKLISEKQKQWEKQKAAIYKELIQKVEEIKRQAEQQIQQVQQDKNFAENMMVQLRQEALKYKNQNKEFKRQIDYYLFINSQLQSRIRQQADFPEQSSNSKSLAETRFGQESTFISTLKLPSFQQFIGKRSKSRKINGSKDSRSRRSQSGRRKVVDFGSNYQQKNLREDQVRQQKPELSKLNVTSPKKFPPLDGQNQNCLSHSNSHKNSKSKDTSYIQRQIMQLHQQYGSEIQELKEKIKLMSKEVDEYQRIRNATKQQFSKEINQVLNDYRKINCQSPANEMRKSNSFSKKSGLLKTSTNLMNYGNIKSPKIPRGDRANSFRSANGNQKNNNIFASQAQDTNQRSAGKKQKSGSFRQKLDKQDCSAHLKVPPKFKF